jgi:hypothetical protein
MLAYTIVDPIDDPLVTSVEVTIQFPAEQRWLFFVTPELLTSVGDFLGDTTCRLHLGERHMIVVSQISPEIIDSVLKQLEANGDLEYRTLPLHGA